jgi:hypothetical protein
MVRHTRKSGGRKTHRKSVPWAGWSKKAPVGAARTRMYKNCGSKCFLGNKTVGNKQHPDFPICNKGTCKVSSKGLWAAYIRSKQWNKKRSSYKGKTRPRLSRRSYKKVAHKASRMLRRRGFKVGR